MGDAPSPLPPGLVERAAQLLRRARHVCVLTGAGISAESGIPTFREAQSGLWSKYDPLDLATPEGFARDPALVWRWYRWRRELVRAAQPNAGHRALVGLGQRVERLTLVTQNVDGLHQRAGSPAVLEYHGNILRDRCSVEQRVVEDGAPVDRDGLSHCGGCGALLRPDVVWFGEAIPAAVMRAADVAARDCDLFVSIGTSSLVYPAAGLAEIALARGVPVLEINPNPTDLTARADLALAGPAGSLLPRMLHALD